MKKIGIIVAIIILIGFLVIAFKYCQNNTNLTSQDFAQNIKAGGVAQAGADPILCAQNPPVDISVSDTKIQNNSATVIVVESYGAGTMLKIPVTIKMENGSWKI